MVARCLALAPLIASFHLVRSFDLNEGILSRSLRAAQLSKAVYNNSSGVDGALEFTDEPNRALFVKEDNVCWTVFRGTTLSFSDWFTNIDLFPSQTCSPSNKCCITHGGFKDAYYLPAFQSELESAVRNCTSDCPECDVIFTGHSQGGAIASIAAIAMSDLDGSIITFGQAASIVSDCTPIDTSKYYRYVNTIWGSNGKLFFDPVPFVNVFVDKLGRMILLGGNDTNVTYYENQAGPTVNETDWNPNAHAIDNYILHLGNLSEDGSFACEQNKCSLIPSSAVPGYARITLGTILILIVNLSLQIV